MALAAQGRFQESLDLLSAGIRSFRSDAALHVNRAGVLIQLKRYGEAIEDATRALKLDPEYDKALNFRAFALMELESYEVALEDLNRALALKPDDVANHRNRAACHVALGDMERG